MNSSLSTRFSPYARRSKIEDTLKVMENVARVAQRNRAEEREKFGFNKLNGGNADG